MKAADRIREALNRGSVKDYTYAVLFFLVSTFFIIFVVRPVLTIAFSLQKEAEELEHINKVYEENISKVLQVQSELEKVRDKKPILSQALPERAQVKLLLDDIQKAAEAQGIQVEKVIVTGIFLKEPPISEKTEPEGSVEPEPSTQSVRVQLTLVGSYEQTNNFMTALLNQRRLKSIETLTVQNVEYLTRSEQTGLQLSVRIDAYYL